MSGMSAGKASTVFVVEGGGDFPMDMLRYDRCCPYQEADSATIGGEGRRQVAVMVPGGGSLTEARWESFGWKVVSKIR